MVDEATLREMALSFPDTTEQPHFEKTSFRAKKKIFATYSTFDKRVCLKLSEIDQSVFCSFNKAIVYPVPNKWGKQGWTLFELMSLEKEFLQDALQTAYKEVTKKK
ncbi:MmcQ/YjbR family DNA-binding protein [Emticicia sp. BO119]|uniref:MmcQ/YjbR family DNA-binding protein n=1 Tax=Emticicia sp. BO119 TaxID=2757768 RepID=UPI0015F0E892|nr:MmcQ/YjbR family DNA-binding protein [Emticicia sp. BO119]MBA4849901.1 MmcQ/YjbR family DNA-binding protein [Emticicia sp. BO119]